MSAFLSPLGQKIKSAVGDYWQVKFCQKKKKKKSGKVSTLAKENK